jgi:hypothetical protein
MSSQRILYCHCTYANVVPAEVKQQVLQKLSESGKAFDAVADLCEMSAKRDPALPLLAQQHDLQIVACYPRAVKWLFSNAGVQLQPDSSVLNMRTETAEAIVAQLLSHTPLSKTEST